MSFRSHSLFCPWGKRKRLAEGFGEPFAGRRQGNPDAGPCSSKGFGLDVVDLAKDPPRRSTSQEVHEPKFKA